MKKIWPIPQIEFLPFLEIEERRPVALITSGPAWEAVKHRLHLPIAWQIEVREATETSWAALLEGFHGDVVYSVGGGLPADAGKYLAVKKNLPMVCLPTALSVDAFLTWASGIRVEGCVQYIETKVPERLFIDFEVLASAPPQIRAAGICDVLSIATGSWDWQYAEQKGMNNPDMVYIPYIAQAAQAILNGALDCAEAAGRGNPAGLKQLLDCLALEVQLCNQVGHARPEEGSEHYFAYALENIVGAGKPHADLLGPGILIMAGFQGQDKKLLEKAMRFCQVPLDTILSEAINVTLHELPAYVRRHGLPYTIAHELMDKL
jgi:glycerol-1-phosphate dehydrogenase [NAD(P)+]